MLLTKPLIAVTALSLALAAGLGAFSYVQVQRNAALKATVALQAEALEAAVGARKRVEATLASAAAKNAATARESASAAASLRGATAANPAWAEQEVPDAVLDALR